MKEDQRHERLLVEEYPTSSSSVAATATAPPATATTTSTTASISAAIESRTSEAARQLLCGGMAGSVAKTITAPFSRLTILFQVHSMVTTKEHRPFYAMSLRSAFQKVVDRGGIMSLWKGNLTSVLHRFPYSAINFYVYENTLDALSQSLKKPRVREDESELQGHLVKRMTKLMMRDEDFDEDFKDGKRVRGRDRTEDTPALHKFLAGASAGTTACLACYPLDLVRTRLTTELEGKEHYRGIVDAFSKIARNEGLAGFYSGIAPTLLVAVPNFAISYTVYGTLKEYTLDDDLFYNLRRIDADSGEPKLGLFLTVLCGAASGILASCITFPMDTVRRRMQIQCLHVPVEERLKAHQHFYSIVAKEGAPAIYRGITPELLKVVPMVGTMFLVYEWTKDLLNVRHNRR
jgi:solute carrier family 25 phosphate transporter 23/24/25/41